MDFKQKGVNPVYIELVCRQHGGELYGSQNRSELTKLCKLTSASMRYLILLDSTRFPPHEETKLRDSYLAVKPYRGKFARRSVRVMYFNYEYDKGTLKCGQDGTPEKRPLRVAGFGHPLSFTRWRIPLANYLKMLKRQQVLALLGLGWTYRRIEAETGVRRETVSRYARRLAANAAKVFPGPGPARHPSRSLRLPSLRSIPRRSRPCRLRRRGFSS